MSSKAFLIAGALLLGFAGGVYAQQAASPVQATPVKRTLVGKIAVPDSGFVVMAQAIAKYFIPAANPSTYN